jgi:hypothetical protein
MIYMIKGKMCGQTFEVGIDVRTQVSYVRCMDNSQRLEPHDDPGSWSLIPR